MGAQGGRLTPGGLTNAVKQVNTLCLYSRSREPGDSMGEKKHRLQSTLLRKAMQLGSDFPMDVIEQVSANQSYGLRELARDKRSVNYESYFRAGWSRINPRAGHQVAAAATALGRVPGNELSVGQAHRRL